MRQLLKDLLTAYKFGLKTLYYQNTRDGAEDDQSDLDDGLCRRRLQNLRRASVKYSTLPDRQ